MFAKDVALDHAGQTINVTSFDLSEDGTIKLVEPPLEPLTDGLQEGYAVTHYTAFAITFGALLCIVAVIAAWLFRTAAASTVTKAAAACAVVLLAALAPVASRRDARLPDQRHSARTG